MNNFYISYINDDVYIRHALFMPVISLMMQCSNMFWLKLDIQYMKVLIRNDAGWL